MVVFHGLGKALRFLRGQRGRSQKQVAKAAGVTPPMVSAYENERTSPELETLDKILHGGLEASLADLCRALDIVNDRLPSIDQRGGGMPSAERRGGTPSTTSSPAGEQSSGSSSAGGRAPGSHAALEGSLLDPSLPAPLEAGYSEITRGLLRISRYVYESVVHEQGEGSTETASDAADDEELDR